MTKRIAEMLLAAGGGSRLGRPKAPVEFRGRTLAERGVALLRDGGADPVVVITGVVAVSVPGARSVHNPDWATGMGSSLAAGLRTLWERGSTSSAPMRPAPHDRAAGPPRSPSTP